MRSAKHYENRGLKAEPIEGKKRPFHDPETKKTSVDHVPPVNILLSPQENRKRGSGREKSEAAFAGRINDLWHQRKLTSGFSGETRAFHDYLKKALDKKVPFAGKVPENKQDFAAVIEIELRSMTRDCYLTGTPDNQPHPTGNNVKDTSVVPRKDALYSMGRAYDLIKSAKAAGALSAKEAQHLRRLITAMCWKIIYIYERFEREAEAV